MLNYLQTFFKLGNQIKPSEITRDSTTEANTNGDGDDGTSSDIDG